MITVYPIYIAPLFNKFTALDEGPLREAIYAYVLCVYVVCVCVVCVCVVCVYVYVCMCVCVVCMCVLYMSV